MDGNPVANEGMVEEKNRIIRSMNKRARLILILLVIGIVFLIVILGLAAATLAEVNNQSKETTGTDRTSLGSEYAESIRISDVMRHLNELQRLASNTVGNRAVNTLGFNQTLDYISNSLLLLTNFQVKTSYFQLRNFVLGGAPTLSTFINGASQNRLFSNNLTASEFYFAQYTRSANFTTPVQITVIPNVGCEDADWTTASLSPSGRVALVKRGVCSFVEKATLASKYNVSALLIYNDGTTANGQAPIYISLGQTNELPALFLSYALGQQLADAVQNSAADVRVSMTILITDDSAYPVGNICADTSTGDPTQTIVIGSHSDSVPAGPGINDNGSGSAANLELALALARLFQTSTYATYKYRVRFCWWGAEELGLLGADYHVRQAKNSTVVGERLSDYLINLNYDMLGSPNFMFVEALPGSNKITSLFIDWFEQQNLPWNYTDFSGRSDYGPFLAEGVVAGGLFSGGDGIKSQAERDYYDAKLGQGMGGIAGAIHDPCYHQACDSIQNIHMFGYEKMVQAAAYVLEYLARQDDLKTWLYPSTPNQRLNSQTKGRQEYNSINEYFKMPYL